MSDPLQSWNDGAAKSAILDFVARVTADGGADYVRPAERIATFDNDGTLWCEQPLQPQVFFLIDRVKELAAKDRSIRERQPFKALLENDQHTLHTLGKQGLLELAQLARLEVGFGDFTRIGVSRINRLVVAEGRFGRVVTTLGIFFRGGSSCDGACICATRFAGRTARFTVIGAWFAAFV